MKLSRARVIGVFLLITFVGCWTPALVLVLTGQTWAGPVGRALSIWQMFPPMIAALVVQGPILKQPVMQPLGMSLSINRWWLVAWLMPVALLAIGLVVLALTGEHIAWSAEELLTNKRSLVAPGELEAFDQYAVDNPPRHPFWLIPMGLPAGLTINLLLALGEEMGLRGLLFREMPGRFWQRSFLIGIVWALWWAPSVALGNLYLGEAGPLLSVGLASLWCLVASPVFMYLRVRSGSVVATAISRGTIMALGGAAVDLSFDASVLSRPFYGWTGIVAMVAVLGAFWLHDRFGTKQRLMADNAKSHDRGAV